MNLLRNTTMKADVEKELGEEVLAVGAMSQGKPPSMTSMLTGTALIGLFKPRCLEGPAQALPAGGHRPTAS